MKIKQNKLMNYCAIPAGVLASAASVSGQTVIFYGENAAEPVGINIGVYEDSYLLIDITNGTGSRVMFGSASRYFSDGSEDLTVVDAPSYVRGQYSVLSSDGFLYGASFGDQNFANISFDDNALIYEAVAQFYFDGAGGGYLVAVAFEDTVENPNTTDLSLIGGTSTYAITAGATAINAASVPEPSSVALLALGATGLLMRRQRKAA